jgi:hypothetical protein
MHVSLYLAVAQWALLGALGVFLLVLFRQLGHVMQGTGSSAELGPQVGTLAAALQYRRPGEEQIRRLVPGNGQPTLIAFVDPTCPSCEELVTVLGTLRTAGELASIRVLALISDPASYLRISEAFSATELEVGRPSDPAGLDDYRVSGTPLLVAIDQGGVVRAAGSAMRTAEVRLYLHACLAGNSATTVLAVEPAVAARGDG